MPNTSAGTSFSSSLPDSDKMPVDEVPFLVEKAAAVRQLSPAMTALSKKPEIMRLFLQVFSRQVQLLKSRSQAFEDAHVTVFDKALLTLTQNGNDLESPAAIEYFCEEFLGIDTSGDAEAARKVLEDSVVLQAVLAQASGVNSSAALAVSTSKSPVKVEQSIESPYPTASPEMEPKLVNLWSVYKRARREYFAVASDNTPETSSAARFLRDTCENIISYLENKTCDPIMKAELEQTYKQAKSKATFMSHGRPRPFDKGEASRIRGIPRGPRRDFPSKSRYSWERDYGREYREDFSRSHYGGRSQRSASMRRSRSPASHAHPPTQSGQTHMNSLSFLGHHPVGVAPGFGGPYSLPMMQTGHPETQPGRGSSGVPYGYSRPVDSYHPY